MWATYIHWRMFAYNAGHEWRVAFVDAIEGGDFVLLQDVLDQVDTTSEACPVKVRALCTNIQLIVLNDIFFYNPFEWRFNLVLEDESDGIWRLGFLCILVS